MEHVHERSDKLWKLGLKFDGDSFVYMDINFHHTDLLCMSEEEFEKALKGASERMKILKENE